MYARYIPPDPVEIVPAIPANKGTTTTHLQRKRKAIEARNGPSARSVNPPKRPKNTHEDVRKDSEIPISVGRTDLEGVDETSSRQDKKERRRREKARKVPVKTGADAAVGNQLASASATLSDSTDRDGNSRSVPGATTNLEQQRMIDEAEKHASILSKFQISSIAAKKVAQKRHPDELEHDVVDNDREATTELHGLTPLPQIDPDSVKKQLPTYSALPSWLANPIRVSDSDRVSFQDLKLDKRLLRVLESKGYTDAFAVQSALLPLLLDGGGQSSGDVCVSAATGSGKTLAYILPIVESLRHRVVTKLRALIVVPTRELVTQVRETCELCQSGSSLQVATAVGSRQFKAEQELLIRKIPIYNEDGYIARSRQRMKDLGSDDYDPSMDDLQEEDVVNILPDHNIEYTSRVDILICTPGRLVDHIRSTRGFTLDDLQWLVIDEADRLLSQSFQEWITITMNLLDRERATSELRADQRILQLMENRPIKSNVRKIVLSATMTRDVGQLSVLNLKKPRLVVVDNERPTKTNELTSQVEVSEPEPSGGSFDLPATLEESAVFVRDESEKPLYLLQLLREYILRQPPEKTEHDRVGVKNSSKESHESSKEIDSASDSSSSERSSLCSDTDSYTKLHSLKPAFKSSELEGAEVAESTTHGALIFTKSNASAIRLGRLLTLLHPPFDKLLSTLTSTQPSSQRRRTLKSFVSGSLSVLIASDLISRGMDIPNLAHVVNYDLPSTVRGYVHRVGRTARAGKSGCAWTLVTVRETKWFWSSIGRGKEMRRAQDRIVRKVNVDTEAVEEAAREGYTDALSALGEEVRAD